MLFFQNGKKIRIAFNVPDYKNTVDPEQLIAETLGMY